MSNKASRTHSAKRLNDQELRELQLSMKEETRRMESLLAANGELINRFKDKFNICETVYKIALSEHQNRMGKTVAKNQLKLDMRQVPSALTFAGYSFDKTLLSNLFGSYRRNGWTAKVIRDYLTHGIDETALRELQSREGELFTMMETFLNVICED